MLRISRAAFTVAAICVAAPAFAILPNQGMWSIGNELNGKPGRGIQVDRQGGETLIITYFGYRPDGSATFMQASGKLLDGREFRGDLVEYRNGRALGSGPRDGEVSQVIGPVSITFETATSGTIILPGEGPQSFTRYQFEEHTARLNTRHEYRRYVFNSRHYKDVTAIIRTSAGQFQMDEKLSDGTCSYTGDLRPTGESFTSKGSVACTFANPSEVSPVRYEMVDIKVDEHGMFSARAYFSKSMDVEPLGIQNYPAVYLQGACASRGPEFADGSKSRCRVNELNLGQLTPRDWISPTWITPR